MTEEPKTADDFRELGDEYFFAVRDYDKAIENYSEAVRLESANAGAYFMRGCVYSLRKDCVDKAIADYSEAIRLNPAEKGFFFQRGKAYRKKGDNDRAAADFGEALKLDPGFSEALMELGNVHAAKGDRKAAILDFQKATANEEYVERLRKDWEYRKSVGLAD